MTRLTYYSIQFRIPTFKSPTDFEYCIISALKSKQIHAAVREASQFSALVVKRKHDSNESLASFQFYNQYAKEWREFPASDLALRVFMN